MISSLRSVITAIVGGTLVFSGPVIAGEKDVIVINTPDVNIANAPDVNVANTPDVFVANSEADPVPVSVVDDPVVDPNPGLPKNPMFNRVNLEHGGVRNVLGPFPLDTRVAIGSLTLSAPVASAAFSVQVYFGMSECGGFPRIFNSFTVQTDAPGGSETHLAFPIPVIFDPADADHPISGSEWCVTASGSSTQVLLHAVGYVIEE